MGVETQMVDTGVQTIHTGDWGTPISTRDVGVQFICAETSEVPLLSLVEVGEAESSRVAAALPRFAVSAGPSCTVEFSDDDTDNDTGALDLSHTLNDDYVTPVPPSVRKEFQGRSRARFFGAAVRNSEEPSLVRQEQDIKKEIDLPTEDLPAAGSRSSVSRLQSEPDQTDENFAEVADPACVKSEIDEVTSSRNVEDASEVRRERARSKVSKRKSRRPTKMRVSMEEASDLDESPPPPPPSRSRLCRKRQTAHDDDYIPNKRRQSAQDDEYTPRASTRKTRKTAPEPEADSAHAQSLTSSCQICGKVCSTEQSLRRHLKWHEKGTSFKCRHCWRRFRSPADLESHVKQHQKPRPFTCQECGEGFCQERALITHLQLHTGKKLHKCPRCEQTFSKHLQLKKHMRDMDHDPNPRPLSLYQCSDCGATFKQRQLLQAHAATHSNDKQARSSGVKLASKVKREDDDTTTGSGEDAQGNSFDDLPVAFTESGAERSHSGLGDDSTSGSGDGGAQDGEGDPLLTNCKICGKVCSNLRSLKRHLKWHKTATSYKCSLCWRRFKSSEELESHAKQHTTPRPFTCSMCGKGFCQERALTTHMQLHTGEKLHKCPQCELSFSKHLQLKKHMREVGHDPKYSEKNTCNVCGAKFKWHSQLKTHALTHDKSLEKMEKIPCEVCGKVLANRKTLRVHMDMHYGDKEYICDYCGKSFKVWHYFKSHMRFHKPKAACTVCGKRFPDSYHLNEHIRIHTKEKPFLCNICGKSFVQKGALTEHVKFHSGERRYACPMCDKRFKRSRHVVNHIKLIHKIQWTEPIRAMKPPQPPQVILQMHQQLQQHQQPPDQSSEHPLGGNLGMAGPSGMVTHLPPENLPLGGQVAEQVLTTRVTSDTEGSELVTLTAL